MTDSNLVSALSGFVKILEKNKINYCLIGGLAVIVRAAERTTKDIDFAISVSSDKEAEEIVRTIRAESYEVFSLLENAEKNAISTVRLISKNKRIVVDLLFNSCGIEKEVVSGATTVEIFSDIRCRVASLSSLIAMKLLSADVKNRIRDLDDLNNLIAVASQEELAEARRLIGLISKRGYDRGKNLELDLQRFLDVK